MFDLIMLSIPEKYSGVSSNYRHFSIVGRGTGFWAGMRIECNRIMVIKVVFALLVFLSGSSVWAQGSAGNCLKLLSSSDGADKIIAEMNYLMRTDFFEQSCEWVSMKSYRPGYCPDNIFYLIESLIQEPQIDMAQLQVLYLIPSKMRDLKPQVTTNSNVHWDFHVVLRYKNHIYDFDFNKSNHSAVVDRYFNHMFGSAQKDLNVRIIPAKDYFENYSEAGPYNYKFYRLYAHDYPLMSLEKFLSRTIVKE